jgi:hypothetical protein
MLANFIQLISEAATSFSPLYPSEAVFKSFGDSLGFTFTRFLGEGRG